LNSFQQFFRVKKVEQKPRFRALLYLFVALLCLVAAISVVTALVKNSKNSTPADPAAPTEPTLHDHPSPSPYPAQSLPPTTTSGSAEGPTTSSPTASPLPLPVLIGTGNREEIFEDQNGYNWLPDQPFLKTASKEEELYTSTSAQCETEEPILYCEGRRGVLEYEIPIQKGRYDVTLHFLTMSQGQVETIMEGVARSFSADEKTEGVPFAVTRDIQVGDGALSIRVVQNTVLTGIEVHESSKRETSDNPKYVPGNLIVKENGLNLSEGLTAKVIATAGERIDYANGDTSGKSFHTLPDAAECYPDPRPGNAGGWIYVSNSEAKPLDRNEGTDQTPGGVGAITFDSKGNIIDYRMLLENTRQNCGGGPTPWNAWISGEEYSRGRIWQVDPTGHREPRRITMGEKHFGMFESFAYYIPSKDEPQFFMTKDEEDGELRRL